MKSLILLCALLLMLSCASCGKPSAANIAIRRENQELRTRLDQTQRELNAANSRITTLESHATTVPVLPNAQLEKLFTTHGVKIGRLTGEADLDPSHPGNEGMKLYIVPADQHGQPIKAAGSFTVDAFDLAEKDSPQIGHWEFPTERGQDNFYSMFTLYTYALPLNWQKLPKHKTITLRVSFRDELTGRVFNDQKAVDINLQEASQPAGKR